MLKKVDVNMRADGVDKLRINMVNLFHLPHGCNCKPYMELRSLTSSAGAFSMMLFSQELCQNRFFLYLSNRQSTSQCRGHFLKASDL